MDPARQIVAELALNAVTHGRVPGRDFRLLLYVVAQTLRIEVTDTARDRRPCYGTGHGLRLVDAFSTRWGWALGAHPRKTVWAEVELPPDPRRTTPSPRRSSGRR